MIVIDCKNQKCHIITYILLTASFLLLVTYYSQIYFHNSILLIKSGNQTRLRTILIWNNPERIESVASFGLGHQPFIDNKCPVTNCYIQVNESTGEFWRKAIANDSQILKSFDAIIFNSFLIPSFPKHKRPSNQRFIWLTQEAPTSGHPDGIVDEFPPAFERIFNWTMSYRKNADIQLPYGRFHPSSNR